MHVTFASAIYLEILLLLTFTRNFCDDVCKAWVWIYYSDCICFLEDTTGGGVGGGVVCVYVCVSMHTSVSGIYVCAHAHMYVLSTKIKLRVRQLVFMKMIQAPLSMQLYLLLTFYLLDFIKFLF